MSEAGKPIRSADFERQAAEAEQIQDSTLSSAVSAEERIIHLRRALRVSSPGAPTNQTPSGLGRMHIPARPGPGAGRIGQHVTAKSTNRRGALLTEPTGSGLTEILREGEPWSFVSPQRTDTAEMRLDPPRTLRYDELLVPVIAGEITATLYGPNGAHSYGPFERTQLLRFDEPRLTNGRVQIQSTAGTKTGDGFIHAGGGLELKESSWAGSWSVRGDFVAPFDGSIEVLGASLYPRGPELSSLTYYQDGEASETIELRPQEESLTFYDSESQTDATFTLDEGESFVVEGQDLNPTDTATHLTVTYRSL